jgi:translation elongation factor P/translation initiation factor 5A
MPRKQTRRCISINGKLYAQLKARSVSTGKPMSQIVEKSIRDFFDGIKTLKESGQ